MPRVTDILGHEGLIEPTPQADATRVGDLTREPLSFPADRDLRLQALARGDEGFLLALGYSTQRGYGRNASLRRRDPHRRGRRWRSSRRNSASPSTIGDITRHRMPDGQPVQGLDDDAAAVHPRLRAGLRPSRAQGDGDGAGRPRAARRANSARRSTAPAQDEEFVLSHSDNVEATGFVEHLKLPHYVDFQAELDLVRAHARASSRGANGSGRAGGRGMNAPTLQLRLSRRADQADDPPRAS